MNPQQMQREFEQLMARALIAEIAWAIIGTAIFFGLLYLTLRYAIRDGLRDANRETRRVRTARPSNFIDGPEIRAD